MTNTAAPSKGSTVCLRRGVPSVPLTDLLALAGTGEVDAVAHLDSGETVVNVLVTKRGEHQRRVLFHVPADLLEVL